VYALAQVLLDQAEGGLDEDHLRLAVATFDGTPSLSIGELWALPVALRLAVLEQLASGSRGLHQASNATTQEPLVRDCVRALHLLEKLDWKQFFEVTCRVERVLREDPAGVYMDMDFATRDRYRKATERIALGARMDEETVARRAVEAAAHTANSNLLEAHVGHYLVGDGCAAFERSLGVRVPFVNRLRRTCSAHPAVVYLGCVSGLVGLQVWLLCSVLQAADTGWGLLLAAVGLAVVPATTVGVAVTNWLVTALLSPRVLPKMDYGDNGLPRKCRTLVAVPCLLSSPEEVASLLERLEVRYLGNDDPELGFALLSDFLDADAETTPLDAELVQAATLGIRALNDRYRRDGSAPFHLLHRRRLWNDGEGRWMGWERKRGKLEELNGLLLDPGAATSFSERVGDADFLEGVRFVLPLDADTRLTPGSALRLAATLDHPLNRAVFDPGSGRVVSGYTVLQPRVEVAPGGEWSLFAHLFSGDTVLDLYSRAVSDAYQDLFGEGTFVGKGIYEVSSFERSLRKRVPENALLSHDLFEGLHGRAGLVSDIVVLEGYPRHYLAFTRRLHRWVRGDWQLLPWLGNLVPSHSGERVPNRLTCFGRWRALDNLRRSLLAPTLFSFLALTWALLPKAGLLTAWALGVLALPALIGFTGGVLRNARSARLGPLLDPVRELPRNAGQWLVRVVFLPHEAAVCGDAVLRTLWRLCVTQRRLLEWVPAAVSERTIHSQRGLLPVWLEMRHALLLAAALAGMLAAARPWSLAWASPLLLAWVVSPLIAAWVSRPEQEAPHVANPAERKNLRLLARQTWLFFEQFVGPEDQWLPPDNVQEEPGPKTAHRTSPTNIGLLLASSVAAFDLGYLGPRTLALRLRSTLHSVQRLPRYRGHPLNWYDTRTLQPLEPRYVSTVDNGNLAASLVVVRQACIELLDTTPKLGTLWDGLGDALALCRRATEAANEVRATPHAAGLAQLEALEGGVACAALDPTCWCEAVRRLRAGEAPALDQALDTFSATPGVEAEQIEEAVLWSALIDRQLETMRAELVLDRPWREPLLGAPPRSTNGAPDPVLTEAWEALVGGIQVDPLLREIPAVCERALSDAHALQSHLQGAEAAADAQHELEELCCRLEAAGREARALVTDLQECVAVCETELGAMDFGLLYDPRRHLFHIGFQVGEERLDPNHYDLLASEARLASFVALSRGQIPQDHWLHLGRPLTRAGARLVLVSWSGTAFEYLMPSIWLRQAPGGLLQRSCRTAVREQIRYAGRRGVPWGISESGFYQFDAQENYQYRAFGLPTLGFKRGLGNDLVVAPYASLLALSHAPEQVHDNLKRLMGMGLSGRYGLFEAVDLTPSRLEAGESHAVVRSYMAHHQGMILLSIDNHLCNEAIVRRFHAAPEVKTVELLLHEGQPRRPPLERPRAEVPLPTRPRRPRLIPWRCAKDAPFPQAHVLSNGRFTSVITSTGGGVCTWRGVGLTPWRADPSLDQDGLRIYVREEGTGDVWTVGRDPGSEDDMEIVFRSHRADVRHRRGDLAAAFSLVVPPDDDLEIRHLHLTNGADRPRRLTVCSYAEVLLTEPVEGLRHPAFAKLFVESRFDRDLSALCFRRRPRSAEEDACHLLHMLVLADISVDRWHESARDQFLGRGRTPRHPQALETARRPNGTTGWTLDPVLAQAATFELPARGSVELAFVTIAAGSEGELFTTARRYCTLAAVERATDEARLAYEREVPRSRLDPVRLPHYQRLLSLLLYAHHALRPRPPTLASNRLGPSRLWGLSISGDLPILLVRIGNAEGTALLAELLVAHELWRRRGISIDLVVLNEERASYETSITDRIQALIDRAGAGPRLSRRGGVFVVHSAVLPPDERNLIQAAARVVLDGGMPLERQLEGALAVNPPLPLFQPVRSSTPDPSPTPPLSRPQDLVFDNGLGGFSPDGREYVIQLEGDPLPPAPWANVIANRELGFLTTEGGCGSTWSQNAGLNRITTWSNDPVTDPPAETLYLRDEESAAVWSPTPLPARGPGAYQVRHSAGTSRYLHHSHQLRQHLRLFVAPDDPVKFFVLELENTSTMPRRLTVTLFVEWILGRTRSTDGPHVIPEFVAEGEVLLARNPWNETFAQRVTFLAASHRLHGLTADRTEFLGLGGDRAYPDGLRRVGLSGAVVAGRDPCGVLQVHVDLPARGKTRIHFILGQTDSRAAALNLARRYRDPGSVERAWEETRASWDELLGAVSVKTPDPALDLLVNRWLLYQALASRLWGRTGLYQSSGAFGFRDQLQDALALVHVRPDLLRELILEAAAHQFPEGDVLHWWHPGGEQGLRSRCSDDLLWLPYAAAHYVSTTGDRTILDEPVHFLAGEPLRDGELERYGAFPASESRESLYRHCLAAIRRGSTAGTRGLPLFGAGDWNDGMNRVGADGKGESVWLGWFLHAVLTGFAPLCEGQGDAELARSLREQAQTLAKAIEQNGWDGAWYARGFFDDGSPLGSASSEECRIDAIAQAWAVISGAGDPRRAQMALDNAWEQLVRPDDGIVCLLTPPFEHSPQEPGYIKAYAPGVRENGGQYTHAAVWLAWAFAARGDSARAYEILRLLTPVRHADSPQAVATYRVEPYVVAADVYAVSPHVGRGGWTWYTGSAAWFYRLAVEAILGLRREDGKLRISPCIPSDWPGFEAIVRQGSTSYRICVENTGSSNEVTEVECDGVPLEEALVPLLDDGKDHEIRIRLV
jgi:cyclic beta-1,2-glucan synthetase